MPTLTIRVAALCGAFAFSAIAAACGQTATQQQTGEPSSTGGYETTPAPAPSTQGPLENMGQPTEKAGQATGAETEKGAETAKQPQPQPAAPAKQP